MAVATVDEVRQSIADAIGLSSLTELHPRWTRLCQEALDEGLRDIIGLLAERGWSTTQVLAWDRLHAVHLMQATYWAAVLGGGFHNFDDRWVNKLDQRETLKTMPLTDDGGIIAPGGASATAIAGLLNTDGDRYTRDTPI
jgi:hypothetical protein